MEKHLVHRQKVTLQVSKKDDAFALQSMVSYLLQNELKTSLESALDKAFPPGKVVRIDTLQLNLGDINPNNFEQEFKSKFITALAESLSAKSDSIANNSAGAESIISEAQSVADALIFFLEKGYLPWYSSTVNIADWETDILKILTKTEYQYLVEWLQEAQQQNSAVIDRLILQFSDHLLAAIIQNATTFTRNNWKQLFTDFTFVLSIFDKGKINIGSKKEQQPSTTPSYFNLNSQTVRNQVWQSAFQVLLNAPDKAYALSILKLLSAHFGIKGKHITTAREKQISSILKTAVVKDAFKQWIQLLKMEDGTILDKTKPDNTRSGTKEDIVDLTASADDNNRIGNNNDPDKSIDTNNLANKNMAEQHTSAGDNSAYNSEEANKPAPNKKDSIKKKKQADEKDIISINTCGLVLLNPFFKPYFERLELMNNNKFINDQARERAVMLLYYLTTGNTEAAEFDLVLQKILCGYPLQQPLATAIIVSETEKMFSDGLLEAVLNAWNSLKNTSVQGLRESFLLRNGNLELRENGWLLKVEQRGLDVLLGTIPWGFSTIRHPWMENILSVDWY
ncbi:contractile injection system tape measure protein [Mucilaginibacter sp. X4EP1]|uniref:contractile injection system tape measure protein n=1 Tax=Mucilaginibacter sp. X4EP1 TaxID=2723092 RepID=UPI00216910AF|nr:contractile injection system tape measure protein [Mucilaginibacter sp. X4EP1]MCS3816018.1 hypothetical protein [Mucilaginibacter sp. X4EP1]